MPAKGKTNTASLTEGIAIMVRDNGDGTADTSATKVKGATRATVQNVHGRPGGTSYTITGWDGAKHTYRSRRLFYVVKLLTDDSRELVIPYSPGHQTYWLA